jgi:hypothetical protein
VLLEEINDCGVGGKGCIAVALPHSTALFADDTHNCIVFAELTHTRKAKRVFALEKKWRCVAVNSEHSHTHCTLHCVPNDDNAWKASR